ncbi:MAG TPA: cytochrome c biogenesis protein CcdA [Tepidisphaeraceae bacterium]|nr:cytochrome c biogenesis protein CcdA [Tepidisphaeraceae bacterium]
MRAVLNYDKLQPGAQAIVAIELKVDEGFHAQSHAPLDENLIALEILMTGDERSTIYEPIYPVGKRVEYPLLGELDVYEGTTIFFVPIEIKSDASLGALKLSGQMLIQICDDEQCFAPTRIPLSIETSIVGMNDSISPVESKLFAAFDPGVWSKLRIQQTPTTQSTSTSNSNESSSIVWGFDLKSPLTMFIAALVAGLLMNVMPCVLPVLPLKAMGFYHAAQHDRKKCFGLGVAFSIGMVSAFAVLAIPIIVMRSVGWGELFSNVWFSGAIVVLLVIVALMSLGIFELVLPTKIYALEASHTSYSGNFLWGVFTAILSTPCTFGALATVLAVALTWPSWVGVSVMITLGIGMAMPYLLLSAFPQFAGRVPKAGAWGSIIKQAMAFVMLAIAAFFAAPLLPKSLRGETLWWIIFAFIALGGLFVIVRGVMVRASSRAVAIASVVSVSLVGLWLMATLYLTRPTGEWIAFSESRLVELREEHPIVVVKFTADWCSNCHVIESSVFGNESTRAELMSRDVVLVKADLSDESAEGWPLLRKLNPAGSIPLTAVYRRGEAEPVLLNGIYGSERLLSATE